MFLKLTKVSENKWKKNYKERRNIRYKDKKKRRN